MTEREVATELGRSLHFVAQLRRSRALAYLPLRPVLIERSDLDAYRLRTQQEAEAKAIREQRAADRAHVMRMIFKLRHPTKRRSPAEMEEWRRQQAQRTRGRR